MNKEHARRNEQIVRELLINSRKASTNTPKGGKMYWSFYFKALSIYEQGESLLMLTSILIPPQKISSTGLKSCLDFLHSGD